MTGSSPLTRDPIEELRQINNDESRTVSLYLLEIPFWIYIAGDSVLTLEFTLPKILFWLYIAYSTYLAHSARLRLSVFIRFQFKLFFYQFLLPLILEATFKFKPFIALRKGCSSSKKCIVNFFGSKMMYMNIFIKLKVVKLMYILFNNSF